MQEQRLFRLAPEAVIISAYYEPAEGWRLRAVVRRQDESWSEAGESLYWRMTSQELVDVICEEVCGRILNL